MIGVILLQDEHCEKAGVDVHEVAVENAELIRPDDTVEINGRLYRLRRLAPRLTKQGPGGNFHGKLVAMMVFEAEEQIVKLPADA
jgi:hypothetical protein